VAAAFVLKLALYVAALGAAGLALTAWAILPSAREARVALRLGVVLALAAAGLTAAKVAVDAAALAGGWSAIFEPPYLDWTLEAQGMFLAILAGGAGLLAAGAALGRRPLAALGGLVMLAGFTTTGHVSGEAGAAWLRAALGVHLLGVAFWMAAPAALLPTARVDDQALLARVRAFSRIALGLVPLALAAGGVLAVVLVERLSSLTGTAYGRLILVKILAAAGAFALGAVNKVWVTARLARDPPRGRTLLRLTLGADAVLFLAALGAVAAATTAFPPESPSG
jgi:putative copper export protein